MSVVHGEGDGFAAKPIADVVCVTVNQGYADGVVEYHFEIGEEIGIDEVSSFLKGVVNVIIGGGVVEVDT